MLNKEREQEILNILETTNGYVTVKQLCDTLYSSESSIRRDLTSLEKRGLIKRSYGGATLETSHSNIVTFNHRTQQNIQAKKANDLKTSREELGEEYTDRNTFDDILAMLNINSGGPIRLDVEREGEAEYNRSVFFKYSGIEDREKVKYVSFVGQNWDETVPNDLLGEYPKAKFFSLLVLANSEEDAIDVLEQMQRNLKPWEWKPEDTVPEGESSGLSIDVPYGDHIQVTEDDMSFYRNGAYILFLITDEEAINKGEMKNVAYYQQFLDELIETAKKIEK